MDIRLSEFFSDEKAGILSVKLKDPVTGETTRFAVGFSTETMEPNTEAKLLKFSEVVGVSVILPRHLGEGK